MLDKIEMSLDDIIKSNKNKSGKNTGRKPGFKNPKSSPLKTNKFGGGGTIKGRGGRGGISRSKYTRVS